VATTTVPTRPTGTGWQQPDVHSRTPEMRNQLKAEFPDLVGHSLRMGPLFSLACADIRAHYGGNQAVEHCLSKMERRASTTDHDLGGVLPAGLLAIVWLDQVSRIDEPECYDHFLATLVDMGGTCVQGDTHRLFATYVALARATGRGVVEEDV